MATPEQTLKHKVYRGMKEYLVISFYLWIILALFVLYNSVILSQRGIPFAAHGFALLNALALGKVMLVARELHFAERLEEKPLIYPTLFKSAAFAAILGIFKIIEEVLVGVYHKRSISESIALVGGGTLKGIFTMMLLLGVLLIPFFGFAELGREFGKEKLNQLFFIRRHPVEGPS